MTRTAIGGLTAGAFTLGILAGLLLPGTLNAGRHEQRIAAHMSAMGSMPMMDMGTMPMGPGAITPADHETHHASPEVGR